MAIKMISKKKAMIFLIDVLVGIILGMTVLVFANVYFSALNRDVLPTVQVERIGNDVVTELYNQGYFDLDLHGSGMDDMKQMISVLQPNEVNMSLEIIYNDSVTVYTIPLADIPLREDLITGTRFVVVKDPSTKEIKDYIKVRYYIWPR